MLPGSWNPYPKRWNCSTARQVSRPTASTGIVTGMAWRKNGTKCQPIFCADQQVLRFAHQGADAAKGRAYSAVHHEVAQESAEGQKLFAAGVLDAVVRVQVVGVGVSFARYIAVVEIVESVGHGHDDCGHGQGVQKGREEGARHAEKQGDELLGLDAHQDAV